MDAPNHYFVFGSEQFSFQGSEKVGPVIGYDVLAERVKENFSASIEAKDRHGESMDKRALEILARDIVRYQFSRDIYGSKETTVVVTFRPPYDRAVTSNDEKKTFILTPQEQDVFMMYLRNTLLSIEEP